MAHTKLKLVAIFLTTLLLLFNGCSEKIIVQKPYIEKVNLEDINISYDRNDQNTTLKNEDFDIIINRLLEYKRGLIKIYKFSERENDE